MVCLAIATVANVAATTSNVAATTSNVAASSLSLAAELCCELSPSDLAYLVHRLQLRKPWAHRDQDRSRMPGGRTCHRSHVVR